MNKNKSDIKWVFFGTPERAVTVLDILKDHDLVPDLIVTRPDSPKGRGQKVSESEVKRWAKANSVPTLEPEKLDEEFKEKLLSENWDLFVVVAYGKILPKWLIDLPKHGSLNVHFSLLPLYRGATPTETQILEGAEETGVTIMLIDEEMDHGPIIAQEMVPMPSPLPTNEELVGLLSNIGGKLLAQTIPQWTLGNIEPQEQEHEYATYTRKFEKNEAEIDLSGNPIENFRKIQAFSTWPRAYFFADRNGKKNRVVITQAHLEHPRESALDPRKSANERKLVIDKVIPEGKKEMRWADFKRNL